MNKNIFIVGNLIWISIEPCDTYGSKTTHYMLCGRSGGLVPNAILTADELVSRWPTGQFREGINVSDIITFDDK
jgi:hypothetical protein